MDSSVGPREESTPEPQSGFIYRAQEQQRALRRGAPGSSSCVLAGARFAAEVHTGNTAPKKKKKGKNTPRPARLPPPDQTNQSFKVHGRLKPDERHTAIKACPTLWLQPPIATYITVTETRPGSGLKNTLKHKSSALKVDVIILTGAGL